MRESNGPSLVGRVILALLTLYALAMIVPGPYRILYPLGSFGLTTNADGLVYDVRGPFDRDEDSPAWRAGLRVGDEIDLMGMRCIPVDTSVCAANLAMWGGVNYVMPGREAKLLIVATPDRPAHTVRLVSEPRPPNRALNLMLVLNEIAGVLVVLGAAWLVWIRPGPMTWGFFVYAMQFNPGQSYEFYAWLQQWPRALMVQDVLSCVLQAAAYAGLLLFALRAPVDRVEGRWRSVERALPAIAALLLLIDLASLGSLFGYRTESWMRASTLMGFPVGAAAILILIGRRPDLTPRDYQRMRWVIWGCLIGLPAYSFAELSQETSLLTDRFWQGGVPEDVSSLIYLINGVLCLFVVEAVRRPTVVSVWNPLRRVTLLGLLLSVPAFFIHEQFGTIHAMIELPEWVWVMVASALVFLLSRAHEYATEFADRLFDRKFHHAKQQLVAVGRTIQSADNLAEVERLMAEEPTRALGLASAAVFRHEGDLFRRRAAAGWEPGNAETLSSAEQLLGGQLRSDAFALDGIGGIDPSDARFPKDVARPVVGVPVANPRRCFAVALYGGHVIGTDLDANERELLLTLARQAEIAYAQVDSETLQRRIEVLERQLQHVAAQR